MTVASTFEILAEDYDSTFSYSPIGKLQRRLVWDYFENNFQSTNKKILEVNGGTGVDALFLQNLGRGMK